MANRGEKGGCPTSTWVPRGRGMQGKSHQEPGNCPARIHMYIHTCVSRFFFSCRCNPLGSISCQLASYCLQPMGGTDGRLESKWREKPGFLPLLMSALKSIPSSGYMSMVPAPVEQQLPLRPSSQRQPRPLHACKRCFLPFSLQFYGQYGASFCPISGLPAKLVLPFSSSNTFKLMSTLNSFCYIMGPFP